MQSVLIVGVQAWCMHPAFQNLFLGTQPVTRYQAFLFNFALVSTYLCLIIQSKLILNLPSYCLEIILMSLTSLIHMFNALLILSNCCLTAFIPVFLLLLSHFLPFLLLSLPALFFKIRSCFVIYDRLSSNL